MPTAREREYYRMGFQDGAKTMFREVETKTPEDIVPNILWQNSGSSRSGSKKRKLSAWNKYVKANSKKPRFRYRNGKLNLKKMAIAFRKTPAGRKKRR